MDWRAFSAMSTPSKRARSAGESVEGLLGRPRVERSVESSSSSMKGIRVRGVLAVVVAIMVGCVANSVPWAFIFGGLSAIVVLLLARRLRWSG